MPLFFLILHTINNNNHHIFGRNGTYVQNIYIKFIFTALSYQASVEQFNSKSHSDKIQTIDKIYTLEYLFQFNNV